MVDLDPNVRNRRRAEALSVDGKVNDLDLPPPDAGELPSLAPGFFDFSLAGGARRECPEGRLKHGTDFSKSFGPMMHAKYGGAATQDSTFVAGTADCFCMPLRMWSEMQLETMQLVLRWTGKDGYLDYSLPQQPEWRFEGQNDITT